MGHLQARSLRYVPRHQLVPMVSAREEVHPGNRPPQPAVDRVIGLSHRYTVARSDAVVRLYRHAHPRQAQQGC